jgi:long-chain fatty acid transport protein
LEVYMKKLLGIALIITVPAALFAGSIDYLSNQSINWMMTTSRNAATDAADIVNYNPAGTVFLPRGLSLDVSNQTLFKFYKNELDSPLDKTFQQDEPTWFLPNLYAVYNFGRVGSGLLAAYLQAGIVAGGGNLNYDDGTAGTTAALGALATFIGAATSSFEASSIYYGIGLGGAYSLLDDRLSVSLGGRMVIARRSLTLKADYAGGGSLATPPGSITAEYEYNALGFTPILGFDVRPMDGLTLALRYEMQTQLEFEYNEKTLSASLGHTNVETAIQGALTTVGIAEDRKSVV